MWHHFEGHTTPCKTKCFKYCSCVATSVRERILEQGLDNVCHFTPLSIMRSQGRWARLWRWWKGSELGVLGGCGGWVGGAHQKSPPGAVCNSKPNTSILWVPSWYNSNPIPRGAWNTLNHARQGCWFIYLCFRVYTNSCAFPVDDECCAHGPPSPLWGFSGSCKQLPGWGQRTGHNAIQDFQFSLHLDSHEDGLNLNFYLFCFVSSSFHVLINSFAVWLFVAAK